jgi:hypothetical protein
MQGIYSILEKKRRWVRTFRKLKCKKCKKLSYYSHPDLTKFLNGVKYGKPIYIKCGFCKKETKYDFKIILAAWNAGCR